MRSAFSRVPKIVGITPRDEVTNNREQLGWRVFNVIFFHRRDADSERRRAWPSLSGRSKICRAQTERFTPATSTRTSSGLGLSGVMLMSDSATASTVGATLLSTGSPARQPYTLCSKNIGGLEQEKKRRGRLGCAADVHCPGVERNAASVREQQAGTKATEVLFDYRKLEKKKKEC